MFQQPSHLQFNEWKCGMKQEGYQQCSSQNQHQRFPNQGKYKFVSVMNQVQHNNVHDPSNRLTSPNMNQRIQPHSIPTVHNTGMNRVTKFIPPLKQEQSTNLYVDTNQMSYGNTNHMVPILKNASSYNQRNQINNTRNGVQANLDATVTQSNFHSRMPPSPNPGRKVNESYGKFDKMTAGSQVQDYDSMPFSRSCQPGSSEEVFNKTGQFQRAHGNTGSYGNLSMASTTQLSRTTQSAALPVDVESTQMLSLTTIGCTEREKMFIFTGTVEKIMKWNKIFRNHFCYFEVIASVVSIQEGSVKTQKVMLLRDKKGPVLQVVYYLTTHLDLRDFYIGQMIRCVGKMTGQNVFNAVSIRGASEEEVDNLERLCLICDQAVSHYLNV